MAGGFLFFTVKADGASTDELWRTDGTLFGTRKVADLPGSVKEIAGLAGSTSVVFFVLDAPPLADALWISDGSDAGTKPVLNGANPVDTNPRMLLTNSSRVYFLQDIAGELWSASTAGNDAAEVKDSDNLTIDGVSERTIAGDVLFFVRAGVLCLSTPTAWPSRR